MDNLRSDIPARFNVHARQGSWQELSNRFSMGVLLHRSKIFARNFLAEQPFLLHTLVFIHSRGSNMAALRRHVASLPAEHSLAAGKKDGN
jgi:hypothetical protein